MPAHPRRETMWRITACALAALPLTACSPSSSSGTEPGEPRVGPGPAARARNVLLITVDTLRADALGSYGGEPGASPSLDRLAEGSLRFENAYSQSTHTHSALSSVLTGLTPPRHGVLAQAGFLRRNVIPLALVLQAREYDTGAFFANVCKLQEFRTVLQVGWDERFCGMELDEEGLIVEGSEQYTWDQAVTDAAVAWIDGRSGPWFAWVHLMDPHAEHRPPPDLWDYAARPIPDKHAQYQQFADYELAQELPPPAVLEELLEQYALEVTGTDRQIGRLLEFVEGLPEAERTAVIFSADHGEELFETWPRYGHGLSLTEGVLRVPLLVRAPGLEPGVDTGFVETLQIAPTVLDLLDVAPPYPLDGRSLLEERSDAPFAVSYCSTVATIRYGPYRLWWNTVGDRKLRRSKEIVQFIEEGPEAAMNPWFQNELVLARYAPAAPSRPSWLPVEQVPASPAGRKLKGQLEEYIDGLGELPDPEDIEDQGLQRQLEQLGYFGAVRRED